MSDDDLVILILCVAFILSGASSVLALVIHLMYERARRRLRDQRRHERQAKVVRVRKVMGDQKDWEPGRSTTQSNDDTTRPGFDGREWESDKVG